MCVANFEDNSRLRREKILMLEFDGEEKYKQRSGMDTYQLRRPYCSLETKSQS